MIQLIDDTEWSYEDLVKHNEAVAEEVRWQRLIKQRQEAVAIHKELFLGREKASDVGKPLKKL